MLAEAGPLLPARQRLPQGVPVKKLTCFYCGRERPARMMTSSMIYRGKMICSSDVTTCLKLRAGTIHERNAPKLLAPGAVVAVLVQEGGLRCLHRAQPARPAPAPPGIGAGVRRPRPGQLRVRAQFGALAALVVLLLAHWQGFLSE